MEGECVAVNRKSFAGKLTKKLFLLSILALGLTVTAKSCGAAVTKKQDAVKNAMLESFAEEMENMLYEQFLPTISFSAENGQAACWLLQEQIDSLLPFYGYLSRQSADGNEDEMPDFRTIFLAEAEEGNYVQEDIPSQDEIILQDDIGENPSQSETDILQQDAETQNRETIEELLRAENEAALQMLQRQGTIFVPHMQQNQVDLTALTNYEILVKQFYTIDANTAAGSDQLNVEKFLEMDLTISKEDEGPQILIYHTHSQEAFADSVPGDASTSIMGVGDYLASILEEEYGYDVLHHRGQYDVGSRDDAYSTALTDIEKVLEENPSIQVVIDLHRDEMPEATRLVMDLDGRPTARFMFFNGLSRTKKTGNISYLYNENLDSNLAFSFQMELKAMEYYPGLTRKIYLKGYRYNMHLRPRYLLIELGAQNNTVEEAMNACGPLAHILDMVLSGN